MIWDGEPDDDNDDPTLWWSTSCEKKLHICLTSNHSQECLIHWERARWIGSEGDLANHCVIPEVKQKWVIAPKKLPNHPSQMPYLNTTIAVFPSKGVHSVLIDRGVVVVHWSLASDHPVNGHLTCGR